MPNTFHKMRNGKWGARIDGAERPTAGQTVTLTKKNGSASLVVIESVIWSGLALNGQPSNLCTFRKAVAGIDFPKPPYIYENAARRMMARQAERDEEKAWDNDRDQERRANDHGY